MFSEILAEANSPSHNLGMGKEKEVLTKLFEHNETQNFIKSEKPKVTMCEFK